MRKPAVLAAVLLLSLTGCTSAPAEPAESATAAVETVETDVRTPAPIVQTDEPQPERGSAYQVDPERFLKGAREMWNGVLPDDDALLAAGELACEQFRAETPKEEIVVVEGDNEAAIWNNSRLATLAQYLLCPEFID